MAQGSNSKNHHWWPVGLQKKYWSDRHDELSWIEPDGKTDKKKPANEKIARKRHGHTIFKGQVWVKNFESEFSIDSKVHTVVKGVRDLRPFGHSRSELFSLLKLLWKQDRTLHEMCRFYRLDETLHRNLLLLLCSLLIRSPANRSRYEAYPGMIGLPPDSEVGKVNMFQKYRAAKELCERGSISNQYFVLLHSPSRKFVYGDGSLDWLTSSLTTNHLRGRALVPLTPNIAVYFCTPMRVRASRNCASFQAAPWMVDWVNEITQVYSKDKLFFLGKPPKLTHAFRQRTFLEHKERADALIDMLDEVAGNRSQRGSRNFGGSRL